MAVRRQHVVWLHGVGLAIVALSTGDHRAHVFAGAGVRNERFVTPAGRAVAGLEGACGRVGYGWPGTEYAVAALCQNGRLAAAIAQKLVGYFGFHLNVGSMREVQGEGHDSAWRDRALKFRQRQIVIPRFQCGAPRGAHFYFA